MIGVLAWLATTLGAGVFGYLIGERHPAEHGRRRQRNGDRYVYAEARAQRERAVRLALHADLEDYTSVSRDLVTVVTHILAEYPEDGKGSDAALVLSVLLARLLNDLHVCASMAVTGYSLQSLTIAAGMLEIGNAAAFIGADEERAGKWLAHNDPHETYPRLGDAIKAACMALGLSPEHEQKEYDRYSHLCMAKHSNPRALSQIGVQVEQGRPRIHIGPYSDGAVVGASRAAIATGVRATWLACMVLVEKHAAGVLRDSALEALAAIGKRIMDLTSRDFKNAGAESAAVSS